MPVGFRNGAGVDLETLFDPDVMGDGPTAPFLRRSNGTAIKFAAIKYGSKGPNVGYRDGSGVDVSNLWAAAGTASYVTDGGLPAGVFGIVQVPPGDVASAGSGFAFMNTGEVNWTSTTPPSGSGTWTTGTPGDYDFRYDVTQAPSGAGTLTGPGAGTRHRLNTSRFVSVAVESLGSASTEAVVRIRIYSRSSGAVVLDRSVSLAASVFRTV